MINSSPTPMDLPEAVKFFESQFGNVEDNGDSAIARNGQPYVTIVSGGIRLEGDEYSVYATSPNAAVHLWLDTAVAYANARGGTTLIWRRKPELVGGRDGDKEFQAYLMVYDPGFYREGPPWTARRVYQVYSRMLVTNGQLT